METATLQTLIEQARMRYEASQQRLAAAQRALGNAQAHLRVLQQYEREYLQRSRAQPGAECDPSAQHNQRAFLARLHVAVQTQTRECETGERMLAAARAELAECQKKQRSLETLAKRQHEERQRSAARHDQKNTDEFAQRAHDRNAALAQELQESAGGRQTGT
jgi:flagellar protein FliJ